mmetsp:Transcript_10379/g.18972  ORF Transcript_10379/g.18972 Transcript_10379/m.18972 type:complete len:230 (-) Transcript_10379:201-890(-)
MPAPSMIFGEKYTADSVPVAWLKKGTPQPTTATERKRRPGQRISDQGATSVATASSQLFMTLSTSSGSDTILMASSASAKRSLIISHRGDSGMTKVVAMIAKGGAAPIPIITRHPISGGIPESRYPMRYPKNIPTLLMTSVQPTNIPRLLGEVSSARSKGEQMTATPVPTPVMILPTTTSVKLRAIMTMTGPISSNAAAIIIVPRRPYRSATSPASRPPTPAAALRMPT